MNKFVITIMMLISVSNASKLPPTFLKCNRKQSDFENCLLKAVNVNLRQLNKPMPEIGLPNFEPLEVIEMSVESSSPSFIMDFKYKNLKIFGFSKIECLNFKVDFDVKTLTMDCNIPYTRKEFEYELTGKILSLPIYGKGPGWLTFDKMDFNATITFEDYTKKGQSYHRVVQNMFQLKTPEDFHFNVENLFDGNKELSDQMFRLINENWRDFFEQIKLSYELAYAEIFTEILNNFFGKVSVFELYGDE